jgi:hypothetical protein
MAATTLAGSAWTTTAGDKTVTATPAVGDLIVIIAGTSGLAGGTISCSDNQAVAGTYAQVAADFDGFSTTGVLTAWVRNKLIAAASSTVFTAVQTGSSGGGLVVLRISGISIVGLGAIRGAGGQSTGTAGTTPAPVLLGRVGTVFSGTQAALTTNVVITAVGNGATAASLTVPAGFAEDFDNGYSTPSTGLGVGHDDAGVTASTITWGATSATQFASIALEVDASVPQYDWVSTGKADKDAQRILQSAVGRASVW